MRPGLTLKTDIGDFRESGAPRAACLFPCRGAVCMLLAGLLYACPAASIAGSVLLDLDGGRYRVQVDSVLERRYQTVMKQQYDYSCGSAALATLLRYHYDFPLDLQSVFEAMYESGDQDQINELGFSLLDIKKYLQEAGFQSEGFRLGLDQFLEQAGVPAIVMIQTDGYKHFVVLKGVADGKVLLGDPAAGLKSMARADFEAQWEGIFFIITNEAAAGRKAFNRAEEWELLARAPAPDKVQVHDVGDFTLSLPGTNDFF